MVYLTSRYPEEAQWADMIRTADSQMGGTRIGASYRLILQHRIVQHVCQDLGLNENAPSTAYVEISSGQSNIPFSISVFDIMDWSGRRGGTYRNNKSLAQQVVQSIVAVEATMTIEQMQAHLVTSPLFLFSQTPRVLAHVRTPMPALAWNYQQLRQYIKDRIEPLLNTT